MNIPQDPKNYTYSMEKVVGNGTFGVVYRVNFESKNFLINPVNSIFRLK